MNSAKVALQRPHCSRLGKGREEDWGYHSGSLVVAREEKATAIGGETSKAVDGVRCMSAWIEAWLCCLLVYTFPCSLKAVLYMRPIRPSLLKGRAQLVCLKSP